jgi:hypothetical protein
MGLADTGLGVNTSQNIQCFAPRRLDVTVWQLAVILKLPGEREPSARRPLRGLRLGARHHKRGHREFHLAPTLTLSSASSARPPRRNERGELPRDLAQQMPDVLVLRGRRQRHDRVVGCARGDMHTILTDESREWHDLGTDNCDRPNLAHTWCSTVFTKSSNSGAQRGAWKVTTRSCT